MRALIFGVKPEEKPSVLYGEAFVEIITIGAWINPLVSVNRPQQNVVFHFIHSNCLFQISLCLL
jgi:hypothetical protein